MRSSIARRLAVVTGLCLSVVVGAHVAQAATIDLTATTIVVPRRPAAPRGAEGAAGAERLAATVLREEIERRTGRVWTAADEWPAQGPVVAIVVVYTHLDPSAGYVVRLTVVTPKAAGQVRLRIDRQPADVSRPARARGELAEFAVPAAALADGTVTLTFDDIDESGLNWRLHSRLVEAWMIRQ